MKHILLLTIGSIALSNNLFSQCPQPGLKILSADCEPPKNLMVNSPSCSSLDVKWKGNNNQTYIIKASYSDAATNTLFEIEGAKSSCDNNGNCIASVPVKESTAVSWSVEAVCSTDGVILYSSKVNGPDAYIPSCKKRKDIIKESNVHVYPNPATNYLMVEFAGRVTGAIEFKVFDITGKKVYDKFAGAVIKTNNQYKLDLRNLIAGTYLLELHNNNEINQTKFVLTRN